MSAPVIAFLPETMNLAETTRCLEVARAAAGRFVPVFAGYGGPFARLVAEAGFPYHALEPAYDEAKIEALWRVDRMESFADPFTEAEVEARARSELAFYEKVGACAVFIGFNLTAYLSARAARLPLVALVPFSFTAPFFRAGLGTWPDQFRPPLLDLVPRAWLDGLLRRWALATRAWTGPFNAAAPRFGVRPWRTLLDLWEADEMLVAEAPEVAGVPELPPGWTYVGPVFARLGGAIPQDILDLPGDRPSIWCSMGSSAERGVVERVVAGLGRVDAWVIAPLKPVLGDEYPYPPNVRAYSWLPAPEINARVNLAVIHGGQGTVQTAAAAGAPIVGVGLQPEQEWNLDAVVRWGSARRVSRRDLQPDAVAAAVRAMLQDPVAAERARALRAVYAPLDGARATADRLAARVSP